MKLFIFTITLLTSLPALAESRFDFVAGKRKIVCSAYSPSLAEPIYIQSPESTARPIAGAAFTVAYRKSFAETVYLGMVKADEATLKDVQGPSRITIVESEENTETDFRADFTREKETLHMICQRVPEHLAAPH